MKNIIQHLSYKARFLPFIRNNFFLLFSFFIVSLVSCVSSVNEEKLSILYPKEKWTYFEDMEILFAINIKEDDVTWNSSLDGVLGTGYKINTKLSSGTHIIYVIDNKTKQSASVLVQVESLANPIVEKNIFSSNNLIFEENKKMSLGICTLNGTLSELTVEKEIRNNRSLKHNEPKIKDVPIRVNFDKKYIYKNSNEATTRNLESLQKEFYVINTVNQMNVHTITANKIFENEKVNVWVKSDCVIDESIIFELIEEFTNILMKKVNNIWGECLDINNDKGLTILFTDSINQENCAIGFFNPADFFENEKDINSTNYNPYSNETDMVYIAVPDSDEKSNYSTKSILATLAHEYTHAINFSHNNLSSLETFLDEGLSHLTESLCGYGESGGNFDFINYYILNMPYFSLCKQNCFGQGDSAGQRGGMCLFLTWLFYKKGGFENDGISFLRRIVTDEESGWDAIGNAYGKPTDVLFLDFCEELMEKEITDVFDFTKYDTDTNEYIFRCVEIPFFYINDVISVPEYCFFKVVEKEPNEIIALHVKQISGSVYNLVCN